MAAPIFVEMTKVKTGLFGRAGRYEVELKLAADGATVWIMVPLDTETCQVTCEPTVGSTARLEACTDPNAQIRAGVVPTAITAWPNGNVTAAAGASLPPVTAFRLVQVGAGSSRVTAVAQ